MEPMHPISNSSENALFASLSRHPVHTAKDKKDGHPLPDRQRFEHIFEWASIAAELGSSWTPQTAFEATFGPGGKEGLLHARIRAGVSLTDAATLARLGILVVPDFIRCHEEEEILDALRPTGAGSVVSWTPRDGGGLHGSFGPTYVHGSSGSGYKVNKQFPFTELPDVLRPIRDRAEALLRSASSDAKHSFASSACDGQLPKSVMLSIGAALRTFAMTKDARAGKQGALNQAFVQRYQNVHGEDPSVVDVSEDHNVSQALGMHFDTRSANGEVVCGLNLGESGYIFFSRRGPQKGKEFPLSLAQSLHDRGEGVLVSLPRRSLYLFYGFCRYHLRHGVPWCGPSSGVNTPYDRITVTLRSVPIPQNIVSSVENNHSSFAIASKQPRILECFSRSSKIRRADSAAEIRDPHEQADGHGVTSLGLSKQSHLFTRLKRPCAIVHAPCEAVEEHIEAHHVAHASCVVDLLSSDDDTREASRVPEA